MSTELQYVATVSDFDLEVRQRLSNLESWQLRQDSLLAELQLEQRRFYRRMTENQTRIEGKMDALKSEVVELVKLLRGSQSNGASSHD